MTQDARSDRVTTHLIFRFKDGSIYEDTTIFSQRGTFRLLSDHLTLRGPSFKQPMDTSIDASTGQVKAVTPTPRAKRKSSNRRTHTYGSSAARPRPSSRQRAHSMWAALSGEYNWQAPESSREQTKAASM